MDWLQQRSPQGHTHSIQGYTPDFAHDTIKEAYHNSSILPVNKWSITFGTPLTLQLEQTTITMEAWLLQDQVEQKHLANTLTQERRKQGTITRFLLSRTRGRCLDKPPG